jgi:hypothetical protein
VEDVREQIARVAIWTGINIDWSTGRLQLASISRETLDLRAHIPEARRLHPKDSPRAKGLCGRWWSTALAMMVCLTLI